VTASTGCRLAVACSISASLLASPAQPPGRPAASSTPSVLALVVEVTEASVRLISAKPATGRVTTPDANARVAAVGAGDVHWIEYAVNAAAPGSARLQGAFLVSMSAIVEPPRGENTGGMVRVSRRIVTVAIPYVQGAATVTFARVRPSDRVPPERWARVPVGTAALTGVYR
jgi:hypothetical protein